MEKYKKMNVVDLGNSNDIIIGSVRQRLDLIHLPKNVWMMIFHLGLSFILLSYSADNARKRDV
jgi:hypothetical protein